MQIEVPDATDGDDPLRTLLEDTFETQDTFQIRFKSACKGLAMVKGRKANIEDLQVYLSDFYELVQGFADRGQIADPDDPDFNVNLIDYFMSNVEPLEMRTKMQESKVTLPLPRRSRHFSRTFVPTRSRWSIIFVTEISERELTNLSSLRKRPIERQLLRMTPE